MEQSLQSPMFGPLDLEKNVMVIQVNGVRWMGNGSLKKMISSI